MALLWEGKRWLWQLLSVACLSLAAKMEETRAPLLLDLQVLEPKFMFEPKTVQRMELFVMAKLKWRLRVITPFDFVDYFFAMPITQCLLKLSLLNMEGCPVTAACLDSLAD
ncbi:unnamed protein product [Camellia sinensis]